MIARIRIISGPLSGQTIALSGKQFLIGREADCHLRLNCEFASRHHCVLQIDDLSIRIADLASKNGTYVNGRRVSSKEETLAPNDVISIGTTMFIVEVATESQRWPNEAMPTDLFNTNTVEDAPTSTPPRPQPPQHLEQPPPLEQPRPPAESEQLP